VGTDRTFKGFFRSASSTVTDKDVRNKINGIIPDLVPQPVIFRATSIHGCDHLADTKALNASKQHYHKMPTDFLLRSKPKKN
jgi:hypothetical protein